MKPRMFTLGALTKSLALSQIAKTIFVVMVSIRLPRSDMALGFKGGYAGSPVRSVQPPRSTVYLVVVACVLTRG